MTLQKVFLTAFAFFLLRSVHAQQDSARLYRKIDNLLVLLNMQEIQNNNAATSAEQTISNVPALAANSDSARLFFARHMGWDAVKTDAERIYARYYSEKEIDELIRFYSSTAGKKSLTAAYEIPAEINKIATGNLQAHANELNRLLPAKGQ